MKKNFYAASIITLVIMVSCGGDPPSSTEEESSSSEVILQESSSSKNISSSTTGESSSSRNAYSSLFKESSSSLSNSRETEPSSSATPVSSNSIDNPSSSSETQINYNPETGILTDNRNVRAYKTTKIGNQVLMAENLNFDITDWKPDNDTIFTYAYSSKCPKSGTEEDCDKYGRLYSKIGFLLEYNNDDMYERYPSVPENIRPFRGVCPMGWHIPSTDEWQILFNEDNLENLLSVESGGTNKSGFNIKLIGFSFDESGDTYEESKGYNDKITSFATVDQANSNTIIAVRVEETRVFTYNGNYSLHYAVRCLMD